MESGIKQRENTGIAGLDEILGGGLEKNKVFLVAGEVGTGKTITCLQFIYAGLKNGENAIYMTAGDKPEDILGSARAMGWDLEGYIRDRRLFIIDMSPYSFKVEVGGMLSARETMEYLYKHVTGNNVERLVMDSLELIPASISGNDVEELNYLRDLVNQIENNLNCTTLITSIIPSGTKKLSMFGILEHTVSGIIMLTIDDEKSQRLISVRKMRADGISLTRHAYAIEKNKGIVLEDLKMVDTGPMEIGKKIPDFSLEALHHAKEVPINSSSYHGKWLVVVFYPGDFTFICPTELEELADNYDKFVSLGAEIISISMDTVSSHKAWYDASPAIKKINYPMGSDPNGEVSGLFGIYKQGKPVARATFVFDPEGLLAMMEINEDSVGRSTGELLRKLTAAKYVMEHPGELCPASWQPGKQTLKPKPN
ncbi:MAG: redoxin domain-containing protein [Candidatus Micrarchaeota archaeon]|nr:redoxin domain-containing protein [Candidatus Micrarchaeota archaeon]